MKAFLCKLCGTMSLALGVGSVVSQLVSRGELVLLPWPVAIVAAALGVHFLRKGGGVEGWVGGKRQGAP